VDARSTGETLDELGDDAIVAQQSQPHSPRPRAQVAIETRSVVISPEAELGGEPPPPEPSPSGRQQLSTEPSLMLRDRRIGEELQSLRPAEVPQRRQWSTSVIWVSAAILAFGLGGLLALLGRARHDAAQPPLAQESFVTAVPATRPPPSAAPAEPAILPEPAPTSSDPPVEPSAQAARARASNPAKPARPKVPREAATPPPPPQPPAAQPKSEIPPGI